MPKKFRVVLTQVCDLELSDRVFDNVDDSFREALYPLHTSEDVAEHIGYNVLANAVRDVSRLDGWANLSADDMSVIGTFVDELYVDELRDD